MRSVCTESLQCNIVGIIHMCVRRTSICKIHKDSTAVKILVGCSVSMNPQVKAFKASIIHFKLFQERTCLKGLCHQTPLNVFIMHN